MKAIFKFYNVDGEKLGDISCEKDSPKFRHLVESGYQYREEGTERGIGSWNRLDTPGDFELLDSYDTYEGTSDQNDQWAAQHEWEESEKPFIYEDWLQTLPFYAFHNEYNEVRGSDDDEGRMEALLQEEKRRGVQVHIGPEMGPGDEY